jgi:2-polyprenyl-3-methyl-5-hydroxy-6-metoxy-1,4-benzoquinol methylase
MNEKAAYFWLSLKKTILRQGQTCPSCGCASSVRISVKYGVTALRRCDDCRLLFRTPTTTEAENKAYYQKAYTEGFTTEVPSPDELERLKAMRFKGSPKDFQPHIELFQALGLKPGDRVLDFGCSWGYGSWQFKQAGFDARGFEVSVPRREYAQRHLGVDVVTDLAELTGACDLVFSSHVMEHVPAPGPILRQMLDLLRPGGFLVAVTPCGSMAYRAKDPYHWERAWGLKHPQFIDELFYQKAFSALPYLIVSHPPELAQVSQWAASGGQETGPMDGHELRVMVRKPKV